MDRVLTLRSPAAAALVVAAWCGFLFGVGVTLFSPRTFPVAPDAAAVAAGWKAWYRDAASASGRPLAYWPVAGLCPCEDRRAAEQSLAQLRRAGVQIVFGQGERRGMALFDAAGILRYAGPTDASSGCQTARGLADLLAIKPDAAPRVLASCPCDEG